MQREDPLVRAPKSEFELYTAAADAWTMLRSDGHQNPFELSSFAPSLRPAPRKDFFPLGAALVCIVILTAEWVAIFYLAKKLFA